MAAHELECNDKIREHTGIQHRIVSIGWCLICLPLLFLVPLPLIESWPLILLPVLVHNFHYFSLAKSYCVDDLSQIYPLFRGLAPLLVATGIAVFAEEWLSYGSMRGIALISFSLISITIQKNAIGNVRRDQCH